MPRAGDIYTLPPGITGVPNATVESADWNTFTADVAFDLNAARPIVAGGTGAVSAVAARASLHVEVASTQVLDYATHVFETGSFWSQSASSGPPIGASLLSGHACVINNDPNYITLEGRENATNALWTRRKIAGVWGGWLQNTFTGPVTITERGNVIGSISSTAGTGTPTESQASVIIYKLSSSNWAGIGAGPTGEMWFRTAGPGGSGTPSPGMFIDQDQWVHIKNSPVSPPHAVNKLYSDSTLFAAREALEQRIDALSARIAELESRLGP